MILAIALYVVVGVTISVAMYRAIHPMPNCFFELSIVAVAWPLFVTEWRLIKIGLSKDTRKAWEDYANDAKR